MNVFEFPGYRILNYKNKPQLIFEENLFLGGKENDLGEQLDGINMWPSISEDKPSPRKQVLLNINEIDKYGAMVVKKEDEEYGNPGTYKIIVGEYHK